MRTVRVLPSVGAALLVLAACAGGGDGPVVTVTALPSATPTAPPPSTPSAAPFDPYPDLADLVISPEGILPLTIGLPPDANPGAAMISFVPNSCYSEEMGLTSGDLDRWITNYPTGPFSLAADDDAVWRIDVWDRDMPTAEGITIGSTIDELLAAYPTGLTAGSNNDAFSSVYWLTGTRGHLVFETQDPDLGLGWDPDATGPDAVILIRVIALGISPDFGAANSGNVAGACF